MEDIFFNKNTDRSRLHEEVLAMVRRTLTPSVHYERITPCQDYSVNEYKRFLSNLMTIEDMEKFVHHCQGCVACLKGISQAHEKFLQQQEQRENDVLLHKTLTLLDELEAKNHPVEFPKTVSIKNFFSIALEASKGFLDLLVTTGELLTPTPDIALRGEDREPALIPSIRILQEFSEPPWSIQTTFERCETKKEFQLTISILNRKTEEVLKGIQVMLCGPKRQVGLTSDDHGQAVFTISRIGDYVVHFIDKGEILAQLSTESSIIALLILVEIKGYGSKVLGILSRYYHRPDLR